MAESEPWPASAVFGPSGLTIGGVAASELAARFGTPLLVFDAQDLRARMRAARTAFPRVAYAVKAFTGHVVVRIAVEEGLDLLCASGGEIEACLRAGVGAARLQLHGNAKTDAELALAARAGIGLVIVDGADELERVDAAAREAGRVLDVLLRVRPGIAVDTHEKIATGHEESKFGIDRDRAPSVARACAALPGVRLLGFHGHAGSQILETGPALAVLDVLAAVAREAGVTPAVLDIGGGFGVTYTDEVPLEAGPLSAALRSRLEVLAAEAGWPVPELRAEPGRSLVANPGCTIYTVMARMRAGGRELVAVDGGMSDNLRPMLYDAVHAVSPASAPGAVPVREVVTIVGRHCESGDVLARDVALPVGVAPGDLLAVAATGAYTYSLASVYNRFGRPAVVGVAGGRATTWLRREDAADMDRLEVALARPRVESVPEGVMIRSARPGDARRFLVHWSEVVAEGLFLRTERADATPAQVRRRFRRSADEANLLASTAGAVVGHISVTRERHPATSHVATLGMAVSPAWRGRGIGAALLAEGLSWARGHGVEKVLLSVYPENTAAIALYRRSGFVQEGRLSRQSRKAYGDVDEILMAAWIGEGDL